MLFQQEDRKNVKKKNKEKEMLFRKQKNFGKKKGTDEISYQEFY